MKHASDKELETAVAEFIGAFQVVFHYDWTYTKGMMGDEKRNATFIEPGLEDESDDWGSRGALLDRYRRLISVMRLRGIKPIFPFPLQRLPGFENLP